MATTLRIAQLDPCRFQKMHHYDADNIAAIASDLAEGSRAIVNPIHVIPKGGGRFEIVAGHDRTEAAKRAGLLEIPVRDFGSLLISAERIYEHWRSDNVLRKQPDRMAAAEESLLDWSGAWSDRRVATVCGVSPSTVAVIRKRLEGSGHLSKLDTSTREGADGKKYKPRTVRTGVPTGKGIPHPTAKVEVAERKAPEADATKVGASTQAPDVKASTELHSGSEVGAPTGAPAPGWITENTNDNDPLPSGLPTPAVIHDSPSSLNSGDSLLRDHAQIDTSAESVEVVDTRTATTVRDEPSSSSSDGTPAVVGCVGASALIAERVAALDGLPSFTADEYRAAAVSLHPSRIEAARAWHRFLGLVLVQADLAAERARKSTQGAAA